MKKILLTVTLVVLAMMVVAQTQLKDYYIPKKGDWAVGITFNPATLYSQRLSMQPDAGDFAGDYVAGLALNPKQMFILSQDPLAAIRFKYHLNECAAFRTTLGINGSLVNYREYVRDDYAFALDPNTQNKVIDMATSLYNSVTLMLGSEWKKGNKAVKFVFGVDFMYTIAGGMLNYEYGNKLTELNPVPSTMPMMGLEIVGGVNDFEAQNGLSYARPIKSYHHGYIHGIGLACDLGLECFVAERLSLGIALNFTPIMLAIQPQTWTVYEGFNTNSGAVVNYNSLISPGSNALLYGTENVGCRISLQYYFGKDE